jgi:23S rRNA pseudouridine2605 synthase
VRLAKHLAAAGVASRRASEELVRAGRVRVGGAVITDPARDVGERDVVEFDGEPVGAAQERVVYALHKPSGVVSTARDTHGRPTVVSLVPEHRRLYPVGRLDADSTGLILLTNDGQLAYALMHPRFEVPKTYRVLVARPPVRDGTLRALRAGIELDDGRTAPARVRRLAPDTLEITIHEGRKRQVRRMCEAVGHRARSLQRVGFGPLKLGDLRPGASRRLTPDEVDALKRAAGAAARRGGASSS